MAAEQGLAVDEPEFHAADGKPAAAGQGGRRREEDRQRRYFRVRGDPGKLRPCHVHRVRRDGGRGDRDRPAGRRRRGAGRRGRYRGRRGARPDPFYAEGGGQPRRCGPDHRAAQRRRIRRPRRGSRRAGPGARADRAPGAGDQRRDHRRRAGLPGDRHRAPARDLPLAYRDPSRAPGIPRRARRVCCPGRLRELPWQVPV